MSVTDDSVTDYDYLFLYSYFFLQLAFSCAAPLSWQPVLLAALSVRELCFRRRQQKRISDYLLCPVHW